MARDVQVKASTPTAAVEATPSDTDADATLAQAEPTTAAESEQGSDTALGAASDHEAAPSEAECV